MPASEITASCGAANVISNDSGAISIGHILPQEVHPRADGEKWKGPRSLAAALPHASAFKYIAHEKISAYWISGGLQTLFLLHAPVSARVFAYFDCARLGKRWFLRSGYKLECYVESWYAFFPVAFLLLCTFSLALPIISVGYMYKYRHKI